MINHEKESLDNIIGGSKHDFRSAASVGKLSTNMETIMRQLDLSDIELSTTRIVLIIGREHCDVSLLNVR